jgi:hypothetical protein
MNAGLARRQKHVNALSAIKVNNKTKGNNAFLARYKASLARHPPPPPKPSKWRGVRKALMIEAMKSYVKEPANIVKQPYLAKLLRQRMKEFPIVTTFPLYRGVGKGYNKSVWPNKGNYVTNKFKSFSKNIKVANKFAGANGIIYVLPPGKYPAINLNNYVRRRYPFNNDPGLFRKGAILEPWAARVNRLYPHFNNNLKNFIRSARGEQEVLFHPGTWEIGNRRNNIRAPRGQVVKNIKLRNA